MRIIDKGEYVMKEYWKVGEIATLTGLTIRTIRYYDEIELFSPSEYTESGHRLYTKTDLAKLHQILALKQIGISLDEIKSILSNQGSNLAANIIETQIMRIKRDIHIQQNLLSELEQALQTVQHKQNMSVAELTKLLEAMKHYQDNYFTTEQLDKMKFLYEQYDEKDLKETEKKFSDILEEIRKEMTKGTPPNDNNVRILVNKWAEIVYSFTGNDQKLRQQTERYHADNPGNRLQFGMDKALYQYIQDALTRIEE